jgi:glycosyltransferase involved in cell wall biosynthesis
MQAPQNGSKVGERGQPSGPRVLMLVSDWADERRRAEVEAGRAPRPEYLRLERDYGVEILDWSRLGGKSRGRSPGLSLRHVVAAIKQLRSVDVVFTDGEHLGIPLALAMMGLGIATPHLMIGHHLTSRRKRPFLRLLQAHRGITRILVHSRHQLERAEKDLTIPGPRLSLLPYFADPEFWRPLPVAEESLIVSAGREHRDYLTMARAMAGLSERVFIAQGSVYSPRARYLEADMRPPQFEYGFVEHQTLRTWYARASIVAVPLLANDFQAGVTTVLESMAMGKATIVSATAGQRDLVEDGATGILVEPGDAGELRRAICYLVARPAERRRLGMNARRVLLDSYSLDAYVAAIWRHCTQIARRRVAVA